MDRFVERLIERLSDLGDVKARYDSIIADYRERALREARSIVEAKVREIEEVRGRLESEAPRRRVAERLRVMEALYREAVEEAVRLLEGMRGTPRYREALKRLVAEAVRSIGEDEVLVATRREDRGLLEEVAGEVSGETGVKIRVLGDPIDTVFGVVAYSVDRAVSYNNTFEARLERAAPRVKPMVYRVLLGGEEWRGG